MTAFRCQKKLCRVTARRSGHPDRSEGPRESQNGCRLLKREVPRFARDDMRRALRDLTPGLEARSAFRQRQQARRLAGHFG
jgi:hypothetical protein